MADQTYDFSGMASVYNVLCSDGKTILPGAFKHQDGARVPLVYQHGHNNMGNIVGNVVLKHQDNGPRAFARFNKTRQGQDAKEFVRNKDLTYLSIWANNVVQQGGKVSKGDIKEVSLVIAGANRLASIDDVVIHSDDPYTDPVLYDETNVFIHTGIPIETEWDDEVEDVVHAEKETVAEVLASFNEDQMKLLDWTMHSATTGETDTATAKDGGELDGPTFADVLKTLNDKQRTVLNYVVGSVAEETKIKQSAEPDTGELNMPVIQTQNIFETSDPNVQTGAVLSHADLNKLVAVALQTKAPSLKSVFQQQDVITHADPIEGIELLFPDPKDVRNGTPYLVQDDPKWVSVVLNGASHTPFSKIKSRYADITEEEARARGYITSAEKFDSKYKIFSRETGPATVYTKNTTDRDDVIDITEFDVLVWLKSMMEIKLREEVARAVLISDGRAVAHADKIDEDKVRPIYLDDNIYAHKVLFQANMTNIDMVDEIVGAQVDYKGSGDPIFFTTTAVLINLMKTRDLNHRRMYETRQALADALMVSDIVTVPQMLGVSRDNAGVGEDETANLLGIIVNMRDYTIGANMGGKTTFFQGFDIDFNLHKQLLETRVSGALTIPKAALVIEQLAA